MRTGTVSLSSPRGHMAVLGATFAFLLPWNMKTKPGTWVMSSYIINFFLTLLARVRP